MSGRRSIRLRRRSRSDDDARELGGDSDASVVRDAEESLVAAMQESDTAVEALHDATEDEVQSARRGWAIGAAGAFLALIGLLVARRRK